MSKTFRQLPSFQGVAATGVATLNCPIGLTYHGILFNRGGTAFTHDMMGTIIGKINGRPIFEVTASDLDDMNLFDGLAAGGANLSYLSFDRVGLKTRPWVESTAIGTGYPVVLDPAAPDYNPVAISTFTLEVGITGATAPTLSAKALQSDGGPLGIIRKIRKFSGYSIGAAGTLEIADLPRGDLINRIAIKHTGDLSSVTLERDRFIKFERTDAENTHIQTDGVKTPQTNWFFIDPTETGNGNEAIVSAVNDFRLKLTTGASDDFDIYVEYLGRLAGN